MYITRVVLFGVILSALPILNATGKTVQEIVDTAKAKQHAIRSLPLRYEYVMETRRYFDPSTIVRSTTGSRVIISNPHHLVSDGKAFARGREEEAIMCQTYHAPYQATVSTVTVVAHNGKQSIVKRSSAKLSKGGAVDREVRVVHDGADTKILEETRNPNTGVSRMGKVAKNANERGFRMFDPAAAYAIPHSEAQAESTEANKLQIKMPDGDITVDASKGMMITETKAMVSSGRGKICKYEKPVQIGGVDLPTHYDEVQFGPTGLPALMQSFSQVKYELLAPELVEAAMKLDFPDDTETTSVAGR